MEINMGQRCARWKPKRLGLLVATLIAVAGWVVWTESAPRGEALGQSRLVSIEPLPEADGLACEWVPASSHATLRAALQEEHAVCQRGQFRVSHLIPATCQF